MENITCLISEMQQFGLIVNYSNINTSGKLQRVATQAKPKSKNGWYVIHINDFGVIAIYGDYQKDYKPIKWTNLTKITPEQSQNLKNKMNQTKIEDFIKKKELLNQINLFYANKVRPMEQLHKYLELKKLNTFMFKELSDPLGLTNDKKLVIPIRNINNELMGLQTIDINGKKLIVKGSQKKGNFYAISYNNINIKNAEMIFIGEGLSTMASIHIAAHKINQNIRICSIVAIDVYNIEAVLSNILPHNTKAKIILVADNDCSSEINIGVKTCTSIHNKYKNKINLNVYIPRAI